MNALILVDVQNDFMPGGSLAVEHGDEIVPLINHLMPLFPLVIASLDWHPKHHMSFASSHGLPVGTVIQTDATSQMLWPDHCIQGTLGASLHADVDTTYIQKYIHKGVHLEVDSYSIFFDNLHQRSTGLEDYLKEQRVSKIYLAGLATDYCVKYSALDALRLGFEVYIIIDACRSIEKSPEGIKKNLDEIRDRGAHLITSSELLIQK